MHQSGLSPLQPSALTGARGGHEQRGPEQQRFHVLHSIRDGFRSALDTGSPVGQRGVTLEDPSQTACRFGPSLNQPRMACSLVTMLASVQSFDPVLQF